MRNFAKTLFVIVGPTAVGKTAFSIELAKYFKTSILSADSRQIFKEMNIGTAKPTIEELQEVPHYFINTLSINQSYDAAQFGNDARQLIDKLFEQSDILILCGGSGLYVKAVCEGFDEIPEIDSQIREDLILAYERDGIEWLQNKMKELDSDHYYQIDFQNPQRLMRALEVKIGTGKSISIFQKKAKLEHSFEIVKIGLEMNRELLNTRIDERVDKMIADGLFEEAESLYPFKDHNALQTVGYQEIFDYMDGKFDRDEAVRLLKRNSRRYAKRQMTWFMRDKEIYWLKVGLSAVQ